MSGFGIGLGAEPPNVHSLLGAPGTRLRTIDALGLRPPPVPPFVRLPVATAIGYGSYGKRYEFEIRPIGWNQFDLPGVYGFVRQALNGNWDVFYVGETDSLERRLVRDLWQHHKYQAVISRGATHIATMRTYGGLTVRENFETDLRRALNPPCNDQ